MFEHLKKQRIDEIIEFHKAMDKWEKKQNSKAWKKEQQRRKKGMKFSLIAITLPYIPLALFLVIYFIFFL